jgi:hypothetical protein
MTKLRTTDLIGGLPPDAPSRIHALREIATGRVFRIPAPGVYVLGRAEDAHFQIAGNNAVSKHHLTSSCAKTTRTLCSSAISVPSTVR